MYLGYTRGVPWGGTFRKLCQIPGVSKGIPRLDPGEIKIPGVHFHNIRNQLNEKLANYDESCHRGGGGGGEKG